MSVIEREMVSLVILNLKNVICLSIQAVANNDIGEYKRNQLTFVLNSPCS